MRVSEWSSDVCSSDLVVAADDGPMPQTHEHLAILDLLGVSRGAVALTKIDRVDPVRVSETAAAVRDMLAGTTLADAPVFPLSGPTGEDRKRTRLNSCHQCASPMPSSG